MQQCLLEDFRSGAPLSRDIAPVNAPPLQGGGVNATDAGKVSPTCGEKSTEPPKPQAQA